MQLTFVIACTTFKLKQEKRKLFLLIWKLNCYNIKLKIDYIYQCKIFNSLLTKKIKNIKDNKNSRERKLYYIKWIFIRLFPWDPTERFITLDKEVCNERRGKGALHVRGYWSWWLLMSMEGPEYFL